MEYDADFLRQINDNVNLLEYAEQTGFDFRKEGKEYFCSCPLHIDNTPSLSITESKPTRFYCHSCKTGGGIITWLTKIEKMRFDAAVSKAAKLAGTDLSAMCQSPVVLFMKRQRSEMPKVAERVEHEQIDGRRFVTGEIPEWEAEGISREVLKTFGVAIDRQSNRIVYPVRDADGKLINYKGRTRYENYKEMGLPKYMNYHPIGDLDYFQGYDLAKPYIEAAGEVIVCESIKSVMKCWTWGIKNVVSAESHALADGQLRNLIKMRVNVVIAFDNDVIKTLYTEKERGLRERLSKLARFTNVYVIYDYGLLGDKDAPMDKGKEVFETLYGKRKRWR